MPSILAHAPAEPARATNATIANRLLVISSAIALDRRHVRALALHIAKQIGATVEDTFRGIENDSTPPYCGDGASGEHVFTTPVSPQELRE